jgi:serine/threonine protein kinase
MQTKSPAFLNRRTKTKFSARMWDRLGLVSETNFRSAKLIARSKLPPVSTWIMVKRNAQDGATFFRLRNGRMIVTKQEHSPYPFSKVGVVNGRKDSTIVLTELLRRKIPFEVPLGELRTKEGTHFYITKLVRGVSLEEKLKNLTKIEGIHLAKALGKYLGEMHSKGVTHLDSSPHNWIVDGNKVRMVDAKYVAFKEEFPYPLKSGGILIWEREVEKSQTSLVAYLPKELRPIFWNAYNQTNPKNATSGQFPLTH